MSAWKPIKPALLLGAALMLLFMAPWSEGERSQEPPWARDEDHVSEPMSPKVSEEFLRRHAIPDGARLRAWNQMKAMEESERQMGILPAAWESVGPSNVGGRINSMSIHPTDDDIIYVGAADGGVWKTTDGGSTWAALTDDLPSLSMGYVVVDPQNPNIVYAATGEQNFIGHHGTKLYRYDQYPGEGVFKSTDGGQTWAMAGTKFGDYTAKMIIDPLDSDILHCATEDGLYRTNDAGSTWTVVLRGIATDVLHDPVDPDIMYAALGKPNGALVNGVYKSTDRGLNWTKTSTGLPSSGSMGRISMALAESSTNRETLYVNIAYTDSHVGVYKTTNGAASWSWAGSPTGDSYKNAIGVDPLNENIVYTGALDMYKTTNGGSNWSQITSWSSSNAPYADHHQIVWGNNDTTIYDVSDGGIYKSTNGGNDWTNLTGGMEITQFQSITVQVDDAEEMFGGTQDRGTVQRVSGTSWNEIYIADGGYTAQDPTNSNVMFTAYAWLWLLKSTNGGASFYTSDSGINNGSYPDVSMYAPYLIDPHNNMRMYAGTKLVYRSTNQAGNWSAISGDLSKNLGPYLSFITTLAVAPSDENVIYAGTSDGNIQVSTNFGNSWNLKNTGIPNEYVARIAVHPTNPNVAYAVFRGFGNGHVFRTDDYGDNWQDVSNNFPDIPCNVIVVRAGLNPNMDKLYVGTDLGVFRSYNNGGLWLTMNNGMPAVVVQDLKYHSQSNYLVAATHGRSAFRIQDLPVVQPHTPNVLRHNH